MKQGFISVLMLIPLFIDGIVYSLVDYSYKIFMIMTQLNGNTIYSMISPLVDRVKALIIVFLMFKVACALLGYLVNPDKLNDTKVGGKALITNILVAAAILGISGFVFDLSNDLSMLMVGSFDSGASFKVLDPPDDNSGFIARLIFGADSEMSSSDNFGKYLATSTLSIFLHSKEGSTSYEAEKIYKEILDNDDVSFMRITELNDDVGRTVEYKFPIISTVMGLYIIYTIIRIAISTGVRMFKLLILQIIAPIPICAIIYDGVSGGLFKKWLDLYIATFIEVFIRIGSMFLINGFIGVFYQQIMGTGTYGNLFSGTSLSKMPSITKLFIFAIVVFAGYTFINELPKFLEKIFGSIMPDSGKGNFGKLMGGLLGVGAGAVTGLTTGVIGGNGVLGTAFNILSGAVNGAANGYKGNNVADWFRNNNANTEASRTRAADIVRQGNIGAYALASAEHAMGIPQSQSTARQRYEDSNKALDKMMQARSAALSTQKDTTHGNISYGDNEGEYVKNRIASSTAVNNAEAAYEAAKTGGNAAIIKTALDTRNAAVEAETNSAKKDYGNALFSNSVNNDLNVKSSTSEYNNSHRSSGSPNSEKLASSADSRSAVKAAKAGNQNEIDKLSNRRATLREGRRGNGN